MGLHKKSKKKYHQKEIFENEYRRFLKENGIGFNEKYLFR